MPAAVAYIILFMNNIRCLLLLWEPRYSSSYNSNREARMGLLKYIFLLCIISLLIFFIIFSIINKYIIIIILKKMFFYLELWLCYMYYFYTIGFCLLSVCTWFLKYITLLIEDKHWNSIKLLQYICLVMFTLEFFI